MVRSAFGLVALVALLLLLELPSQAAGGTVSTGYPFTSFVAFEGEANRVTVALDETGTAVRIVDTGALLTASGDCVSEDANTAICPYDTNWMFDLGDLDDVFTGPPNFRFQSALMHIRAGEGDDYVTGGTPDTWAYGGPGHDTLNGGEGYDRLRGGSGNDVLRGGRHPDRLYGGSGNDRLEGGHGRDRAIGGPGDDVFYMRDAFGDNVWGQLGHDRANVDRPFDRLFGVEALF